MEKFNLSERVKNGKQGKQFAYVLECINNSSSAYDQGIEFENDLQRISFVLDSFKKFDYPDNKKRIPNLCDRIADWLQGLPGQIAIDYENYKIISLGQSWGYCQNEKKTDDFIDNWFSMVAYRLLQIAEKVGYNTFNI